MVNIFPPLPLCKIVKFIIFGIRFALYTLIRLGPDPEYSIDGKLPFGKKPDGGLILLGSYPRLPFKLIAENIIIIIAKK